MSMCSCVCVSIILFSFSRSVIWMGKISLPHPSFKLFDPNLTSSLIPHVSRKLTLVLLLDRGEARHGTNPHNRHPPPWYPKFDKIVAAADYKNFYIREFNSRHPSRNQYVTAFSLNQLFYSIPLMMKYN